MLGILLIFFIGRYFYRLAEKYDQNKWLYAILGIVTYYSGTFIGGIILAILDEFFLIGINWNNNFTLGLIALPFGLVSAYLFYFLLNKKWKKSFVQIKDEIQDIGKSPEELEEEY